MISPIRRGDLAVAVLLGTSLAVADMSVDAAMRWALPNTDSMVEEKFQVSADDAARLSAFAEVNIRPGEIAFRRGARGTNVTGYALMVDERGRDDSIRFIVAFEPDGRIRDIEVVEYRGHHGNGICDREFLDQFRRRDDPLQLDIGAGIDAVSGATISSRAATRAARRALVLFRHTHPEPAQ